MFKHCDWIWGGKGEPDEYIDYRLDFTVTAGRQYLLHLSCDTDYALYAGERLLAFGQYADYPYYRVYDTVDLSFLAPGEHSLTLTVWYQGVNSQTYIVKPASLIFSLTEDGRSVLTSGEHTPARVSGGYVPYGCKKITGQLGLTFEYDATRPCGEYAPAHKVEGFTKDLVPRPVEKLGLAAPFNARVVQSGGFVWAEGENNARRMLNSPLTMRTLSATLDGQNAVTYTANDGEDGVYAILDMGRETAGILTLDFTVDSPCTVLIGWGEHLVDGRVRTAIHARDFSCEYRAKAGENKFIHPMRRLGCRYLQVFIEAKRAHIRQISICETAYPLDIKPLEKGNLLQRRIYDVCVNTLIQCMHEHYEDCPWREQALYTMDSRNQMLCGYYTFSETRFPRACLELISHGLREDGILSLCYPAGNDLPIPSFSLMYFVQMREYLDHSGDADFLEDKYPFLVKLMSTFTDRVGEYGLISIFEGGPWNFYEWSPGLEGNTHCKLQAPLNAFYSLALQNLADIASALGKDEDSERFTTESERMNKAIRDYFYNPDTGLFRSFDEPLAPEYEYSVLTNSLCLLCGAAEGVNKETILKVLASNGPADTGLYVLPNTLSMNTFRFDALLSEDAEHYRQVILDEIDRTYLAMLEQGATSFWETAQGVQDFGGSGSLCHGWSALPAYYYQILL